MGTRGAPRAALHREAGVGAQRTHADLGAALSQEVGTGAVVTHGAHGATMRGPKAALSREVGTRAAVTRAPLELPCVGRRVLPPELP
jgi:hypothetical protein